MCCVSGQRCKTHPELIVCHDTTGTVRLEDAGRLTADELPLRSVRLLGLMHAGCQGLLPSRDIKTHTLLMP
jgi:hypothetical protein